MNRDRAKKFLTRLICLRQAWFDTVIDLEFALFADDLYRGDKELDDLCDAYAFDGACDDSAKSRRVRTQLVDEFAEALQKHADLFRDREEVRKRRESREQD